MATRSEASKSPREIERKFLVRKLPAHLRKYRSRAIRQGYLVALRDGTQVRLRQAGKKFTLAFKKGRGVDRLEWEMALKPAQFALLWPATRGRRLRKKRCEIPYRGLTIEIDTYAGRNRGLVVAEVEFETVRACRAFVPPPWLGREVSGQARYSNVLLARE